MARRKKANTSLVLQWSWRDVMTARQIDVLFNGTGPDPNDARQNVMAMEHYQDGGLGVPYFRFSGPGLYLTAFDSVLIVPQKHQPRPWRRKQHPSVKYDVYVWNGVDISATINLLSNAPVRVDER